MSELTAAPEVTLNDRVAQLFAEQLNLDVPSPEAKLIDDGYLDSLLFIDLLVALEEEFGVAIALHEVDFDKFETINAVAAFVATHGGGGNDG